MYIYERFWFCLDLADNKNESIIVDLEESFIEFNQLKGHKPRELTEEEKRKLANDKFLVSEFKHNRYEIEAKKNWDLFYRRYIDIF